MAARKGGHAFFLIGLVALVLILVAAGFFSSQLGGDGQKATPDNAPVGTTDEAGNSLQYDPLVTVVPEELRGGTPQPLATDPWRGAQEPTVVLMEFGDFQCEACAQMKPVIEQLLAEYPDDLLHVWKDFPIPSEHPQAETAALAARCAQDQNAFWPYHDLLLQEQGTLVLNPWKRFATELGLNVEQFEVCLQADEKRRLVVESYFIARSLDLVAAPAYYINEESVTGYKTVDELREIIERQRDEAAAGE